MSLIANVEEEGFLMMKTKIQYMRKDQGRLIENMTEIWYLFVLMLKMCLFTSIL